MVSVRFRYGLDWISRCGLLSWSLGWLIGILFVLVDGKINSHQETYTRGDSPGAYWTLVAVAAAMFVLGLFMTFELSFEDGDQSSSNAKE